MQDCPPSTSGWPDRGYQKVSNACFHTMELSWMFNTVSAFWPWLVPPNGSNSWPCTWSATEREFSRSIIQRWVTIASSQSPSDWLPWTITNRERLNLKIGETSIVKNFSRSHCNWWRGIYAQLRQENSSRLMKLS